MGVVGSEKYAHTVQCLLQEIKTNTHTHTFPGGDESGQELAEVGSGVRVLRRRQSFQLGGRTSVPDVGLFQTLTVRLDHRS